MNIARVTVSAIFIAFMFYLLGCDFRCLDCDLLRVRTAVELTGQAIMDNVDL
jgi:hypothetical protein